jgi:hypothetical protein
MTSTTRLTRLYDIFLSPWICFASRSHAGLGTQSIGLSEPDKLTGSGTCPDTPRYSYTTPLYLRKLPIRPGTAVEIHLSHSTPANFQASAKTERKKNFLPFRGCRRFVLLPKSSRLKVVKTEKNPEYSDMAYQLAFYRIAQARANARGVRNFFQSCVAFRGRSLVHQISWRWVAYPVTDHYNRLVVSA